jgi:hypothetical protein
MSRRAGDKPWLLPAGVREALDLDALGRDHGPCLRNRDFTCRSVSEHLLLVELQRMKEEVAHTRDLAGLVEGLTSAAGTVREENVRLRARVAELGGLEG